jgi:hypothetical protein
LTKQELSYYPDKITLMEYKEFHEDNLVIHKTYYPNGIEKYNMKFIKNNQVKYYYNQEGKTLAAINHNHDLNIIGRQLKDENENYIIFTEKENCHTIINASGHKEIKQKVKFFTAKDITNANLDSIIVNYEIAAIPISVMKKNPRVIITIKNILENRKGYIFWYKDFE